MIRAAGPVAVARPRPCPPSSRGSAEQKPWWVPKQPKTRFVLHHARYRLVRRPHINGQRDDDCYYLFDGIDWPEPPADPNPFPYLVLFKRLARWFKWMR